MPRPTKEFILSEIRRCAADNGGAPLGKRRFEAETDIRESDWTGRYWVRWNDAVREAGFEPNARQGRVHDDDALLELLASLTRDLGGYPTVPEMRMRRLTDPSVPNSKTISNRLGNRTSQVELLINFTAGREDLRDVHDLIAADSDAGSAVGSVSTTTGGQSTGFVYLMRHGKHHKIGRSNSVGRRGYEVALQLPEKVELVHSFETDDPVGIERYWHDRFADRRTNGEWFLLTKPDIAAFKARRRFM